jgi:hypothetical protein
VNDSQSVEPETREVALPAEHGEGPAEVGHHALSPTVVHTSANTLGHNLETLAEIQVGAPAGAAHSSEPNSKWSSGA